MTNPCPRCRSDALFRSERIREDVRIRVWRCDKCMIQFVTTVVVKEGTK